MIWIIIGVVVLFLIIFFVGNYNSLVKLKNRKDDQWAQIEVQLKKRADLIPNLVEVVKGYAKHEKSTFEDVVKVRNAYASASSFEDEVKASGEVTKALNKLFALAEAYPELKANENFLSLQNDLKDVEEKISVSRQFYNDTVLTYNNKVMMFPSNIVASLFKFEKGKFFEASEEDKKVPKVSF